MTLKSRLIAGYFVIALGFAIYLANWGALAYRGFAYNLGRAIFWPFVLFPSAGVAVGGLIMVVVVIAIVLFTRGGSR
ncbi:hypothetical protein DBA29_25000 [Xenophilus aerolatus]|nr:hypothetical protein [Xenophilus aerolatus]